MVFILGGARIDVPESQCLIASTRHYGLSIGTHGKVQHPTIWVSNTSLPVRVTRQGRHSLHLSTLPQHDLILAVAVSADDFVVALAEHQVAHLAARILLHEVPTLQRIPEPNCAVGRPTSTRQQSMLVGTPSNGLDGSLMLAELANGVRLRMGRPQVQLVVVAARSQNL